MGDAVGNQFAEFGDRGAGIFLVGHDGQPCLKKSGVADCIKVLNSVLKGQKFSFLRIEN
jgi:hypothetical protein